MDVACFGINNLCDATEAEGLVCGCCFEGSSGTFLRAAEDHSRSLEEVEEKMARATMIPRVNGEVCKSIVICISKVSWLLLSSLN